MGVREGTDLICSSLEGKDGIREGGKGVCSKDGGWEKLFGRWGLIYGKSIEWEGCVMANGWEEMGGGNSVS